MAGAAETWSQLPAPGGAISGSIPVVKEQSLFAELVNEVKVSIVSQGTNGIEPSNLRDDNYIEIAFLAIRDNNSMRVAGAGHKVRLC